MYCYSCDEYIDGHTCPKCGQIAYNETPTRSAGDGSLDRVGRPTDAEITMELALRAADEMARICDDWVTRGIIGERSALADARLSYGEPFKYKWSRGPTRVLSEPGSDKP